MFKIKSGIFEKSSHSLGSPKLHSQLISFVIVFFVIYILEAIVPSFLSLNPMMEEMQSQGLIESDNSISLKNSMAVATLVSASPKIMIPSLISTVFGTITSVVYCRNIEVRPLNSMGVTRERLLSRYLFGLLMGMAMMTLIVLLSVLFGVNSLSPVKNFSVPIIMLYFVGFFFQGMSEEFIFRGYLMTTIGGHHSAYLAIAVNSLAFAFAHSFNVGFGVLPCANLILFGVFASLFMICTDSIWGVCGIHSVWNFMQGNFYGISVSGTSEIESVLRTSAVKDKAWLSGGSFGIEGSIFTTVVLLVGIMLVILRIRKNQKVNDV